MIMKEMCRSLPPSIVVLVIVGSCSSLLSLTLLLPTVALLFCRELCRVTWTLGFLEPLDLTGFRDCENPHSRDAKFCVSTKTYSKNLNRFFLLLIFS